MRILALDGALARASAAVWAEGRVLAARSADGARGQAIALPPMVAAVLAEAGVKAAALDAVAAVVGPGGFTGIRAALALAQGLALAAGRPAIGVSTGEALAAALPQALRAGHAVWSATDTRRGRILLERFAPGALDPLGPPEPFSLEALPVPEGPVALVGDAAPLLAAVLGDRAVLTDALLPEAAAVAAVAALRLAGKLPPRACLPLYVEPPAVKLPPGQPASQG
ncbi:tRNA (adenosine(37)-N6)-threonylcarbamoyltransferase complex dimerization subunit type 1 TsaB [Pseudoroseomonas deserti]|uniref:tRNA (Adenosine(37)-N6)-threonylcarbamoyltransferase complex dimerization subunit type 1 TsaB n=1 Tax=Teichococcus deserti TaxID=1817963 RepID=A0A1V2H1B6_9PROT|nr:tRNA (adenosine(37)-N6)-threonylcarbamoyltransferase complex dimerization subunit type 1 TsaB [Pseudoroseomonas deserti]ONG52735.1 tRNA (adenosine(37)-N6)-threonylcarbamoyltransferase complex dimerization subunit type 1 TsaB [Pseudoroseomonas deserti]